jgi:hypothetical protein
MTDLSPEELVSEIFQKLLGAVSLDERGDDVAAASAEWSVAPDAPECDGRVIWLIGEIGGSDAIAHRCEDIQRQRYGRSDPTRGGRRIVQIEGQIDDIGWEPDQPRMLQQLDAPHIWYGLLITVDQQFHQHDDISMVLHLLNDVRDIFDDTSSQWPVKRMMALLNERFPPPNWTEDRVDNAKRRLIKWIKGLMQKNGLDVTDLEDLFARVARQRGRSERKSLAGLHRPKPTN